MGTLLGLSIVAAAPAAWIYFSSRSDSIAKPRHVDRGSFKERLIERVRRNFRASSIHPGESCCRDAEKLAGKRFLAEEVPRLPLDSCDRIGDCECIYRNFADRRISDDRRNIFGALSKAGDIGMRSDNNRSGMDRRSAVDGELDGIEFDID